MKSVKYENHALHNASILIIILDFERIDECLDFTIMYMCVCVCFFFYVCILCEKFSI